MSKDSVKQETGTEQEEHFLEAPGSSQEAQEAEETVNGTPGEEKSEDGQEEGPAPLDEAAAFEEALKANSAYRSEFDRRVGKAVADAVAKAQKGWEAERQAAKEQEDKSEAAKLETEIEDLKKQIQYNENFAEAKALAAEMGVAIPDRLLEYAIFDTEEETLAATAGLCAGLRDSIQDSVKKALAGPTPKAGKARVGPTREQILAEKDSAKRRKLIAENPQLFTGRKKREWPYYV